MKHADCADEPLKGFSFVDQSNKRWRNTGSLRGPKRALKLCLMGILLPALLISIPTYLRYRVYDTQLYPMAISDMRLIDSKISTTWCQSHVIHSNISFNAFLMPTRPELASGLSHVEMTRHLRLDDDMKEYWGFYLLKGSTVTVSTCARWPGASLILIKGHRHLHECAYIGDDSSEEEEELREIEVEKQAKQKGELLGAPNRVDLLRKHRPEVQFLGGENNGQQLNATFSKKQNQTHKEEAEVKSAKEMRDLLDKILFKADKFRANMRPVSSDSESLEKNKKKAHHKTNDNQHKHRETQFGPEGGKNVNFETPETLEITTEAEKQTVELTSIEVFENILQKLQKLGPRGRHVLASLKKELMEEISDQKTEKEKDNTLNGSKEKFNRMDEEINHRMRKRREIILKTALKSEFNAGDETENLAIEEGFVPDEHADHHHVVNETTLNDKSNSEFWSSFSSSEEALLNCAGLILSLPLTPHPMCNKRSNTAQLGNATAPNTVTYTVTANGYYFFVFSSENEVQENYIRTHFDLHKVVYNVTHPLLKCSNSTGECSLPLDIFTNEKVVIELPINEHRRVGNEEFIFISECQPRTAIYLVCILAVPLLIITFAFQ